MKTAKAHWGGDTHTLRKDGAMASVYIRRGTAPERRKRKSAVVHTSQPLLSENRREPRCGQTGHRWRTAAATISSGWTINQVD